MWHLVACVRARQPTASLALLSKSKCVGCSGNLGGTVVRLYGGTNATGNTKFYEIHDVPGSTSRVKVDRAGSEYQF